MFKKIPKNVFVLGLVSFFNDIASEMIYPIVPIFLTSVLQVPVSIIGLIEGVAEVTASIMKFIFGYISDKTAKRKLFVTGGYGLSAASKALMGLAYSWPFVLFSRFIDRSGKGVRTSARDALLLQNSTSQNKGFIFGFHRAMDSAGAIVGPLIALVLLYFLEENIRLVFFLAFIPSAIGVILLILFIREKKKTAKEKKFSFSFKWKDINPKFKFFLLISIIFGLGNSSDAFLILRAQSLGFSAFLVTLAYVFYNVSQTIFSTPAGSLADKIGARRVYGIGLLIFAAVYLSFAVINDPIWIWIIFPIYGVYIAFTDGVSKAYIAQYIEEKESGTYFGIYQTGIALSAFFASFLSGILWTKFGPSATFFYGSAMAILALLILSYGKLIKGL
ncbi:MAG TPA: MFS transporter [Patescibacteria group bacterium]|nr:MFS transporter [Patescibacteria group bacterium]